MHYANTASMSNKIDLFGILEIFGIEPSTLLWTRGGTPIFDTYRNRFSFFSETGNYLILTKMKQKQRGNKLNILLIVVNYP